MTKDEFIQIQKSAARRETRALWVGLTVFLVVPVLLVFGGEAALKNPTAERFFESLVTTNRHLLFVGFGLVVLTIVLAVVAAARNPGGVRCPKCGKPIRGVSSRVTLLTSNCGRCGERIIS